VNGEDLGWQIAVRAPLDSSKRSKHLRSRASASLARQRCGGDPRLVVARTATKATPSIAGSTCKRCSAPLTAIDVLGLGESSRHPAIRAGQRTALNAKSLAPHQAQGEVQIQLVRMNASGRVVDPFRDVVAGCE
jgi:hypothetical protein